MRSASFVTSIILISLGLSSCGPSLEGPPPTAIPTITSLPTEPPPPTDTPTPITEPTTTPISITTFEDMEGVWSRFYRGAEFELTLYKDGGVTHVEVYFPQDVRNPDLWFEDGRLYIQETTSSCSRDQVGIYEITGTPGEYLIFTPIEDPCEVYRNFRGKWTEISTQ
jgi:hypothetical protein